MLTEGQLSNSHVVKSTFRSTKTYGHDVGLSCCFRQWRANSHCSQLHGYSLSFKFVFEGKLDNKNWVADYGDFKELKEALKDQFDHRTVIAKDDPELEWFKQAHVKGVINLNVVDGVGCEMFAQIGFRLAKNLIQQKYNQRVWVVSCEVAEHGANSSIYSEEQVYVG